SCHSLSIIQGKIHGDPLELRMFETSGWTLLDTEDERTRALATVVAPKFTEFGYFMSGDRVGIMKRFEFLSKLQRMSVIVKDPNENSMRIYMKGSPEVVKELCR